MSANRGLAPLHSANRQQRICVVGAGTRFLSGISYYTLRLANALTSSHRVSAVLMRHLLPTRFYPGRRRVGASLTRLEFSPAVRLFDGVDWWWLPSLFRAIAFLIRERPDAVVFQWWSGTVLHSYLALAVAARLLRARVVIEFHEVLDSGEARLWLARAYVHLLAPFLVRLASGFVVHSEYDRALLGQRYALGNRPSALLRHGPYDHYQPVRQGEVPRTGPDSSCSLLFFGVIRPFKGLEDLLVAFDGIPEHQIAGYRLTVVGETWEGWTKPAELIARSRYPDRITFVNRYVRDEEVASFFASADAVVLPYHRSSASGPLHVAMSHGLPVVVTQVGGLVEAVAGYEGAILVPPRDPVLLRGALAQVAKLRGRRFADRCSWDQTVDRYQELFKAIACGPDRIGGGRESRSMKPQAGSRVVASAPRLTPEAPA
jgi:glycosyltransferase involved in cell wall biosynthesis